MNFKKDFVLREKADITMLIAAVASSKHPEMEEFNSPFNTVAPSGRIHKHFVLLFHAHECKALALLVTNLRLWNIYNIITLLLPCYTHASLSLWAIVEELYWCGRDFLSPSTAVSELACEFDWQPYPPSWILPCSQSLMFYLYFSVLRLNVGVGTDVRRVTHWGYAQ